MRARAGERDRYTPVESVAGEAIDAGNARALARIYRDRFGLRELYIADLDAIEGRSPQDPLVASLAGLAPLWLDAGVSSLDRARDVVALGAAHVVVGLETLTSWEALDAICAGVDRQRIAFSLDVRGGVPLGHPDVARGHTADALAARAAGSGVGSIIVLDLARVGMNVGIDTGLIARVRQAAPDTTLLAGGGVRGPEDLVRLADHGCDGALVATALLDGRIGAADVAAVQSRQPSFSR